MMRTQLGLALSFRRAGRSEPRRHWVAAGIISTLTFLLMTFLAAPAWADWGIHSGFGAEAEMVMPVGVAVDEPNGDVYVGSFAGGEVSKFDEFAHFLSPPSPISNRNNGAFFYSGLTVNPTNEDVYAVNAEEQQVEIFNPEGTVLGEPIFAPGSGNLGGFTVVEIAADANGYVYVPNAESDDVEVFNEKGKAQSTITGSGVHALKKPEGVAIGPEGNVWAADTEDNRIEEFEADGAFVREIASPGVRAVALDGSGDVFASIGGAAPHVNEYSSAGAVIAENIGEGLLSESGEGTLNGIAFDRSREILYVANGGGNDILRFTDWAVSTGAASSLEPGKTTLSGTIEVEPGASVGSCRFEYGPTTAYGESVPCSPTGPYTADTSVSATISRQGGDTHYRIAISNANGEYTKVGEDQVFGPPEVNEAFAEAIVTTATLRAHVTVLETGESTCEVQYVAEPDYVVTGFADARLASCTKPIDGAPGGYEVEAEEIKGLQPDTVYHYRFVTEGEGGVATGPSEEFATFGIVPGSFIFQALNGGAQVTQAAARPLELTDTFRLNTSTHRTANGVEVPLATDANPKDILTELPAGLVGNPDATPKCDPYDVAHADCSGATQVGIMEVRTSNPGATEKGHLEEETPVPIYNLVPPKGLAAQFGARFNGFVTVHIDARVRTGGDYGVTAEVLNSSAGEGVVVAEVTLWGVPAAESHDDERYCPSPGKVNEAHFGESPFEGQPCTERGSLTPFLSNPAACTGEREAKMTAEPWQEDEPPVVVSASAKMPAITGCGKVHFVPSMLIAPTTKSSDSPSGLDVELTVPQNEDPNGLATADLKDAKVVLPEGVTVNPSEASGLVGCPLLTGKEPHPGAVGIDLENGEPANCPNASKIGKVVIHTPLLEEEVEGGVYVAQQNANPFKSLLALYIAVEAPERGVVVKLAGRVELNETTGQLTTTFDEDPQLPFETLKLDFFGGERAPLATPRTCGSYEPTALLEPWSHQGAPGEEGTPDAEPHIDPLEVTSGPGGSACANSSFAPSFEAGAMNNQAGGYGGFVLNLTRKDGEQRFSTVSMTMPPGLAGMISKVSQCANAQAEVGDCPVSSKIGHVTVEAGVGNEPITVPEAGKPEDPVYLTGPYKDAPFGLSIVVPAEAGPFNLGTVVVRAKIEVNPHTGQVSIASEPMPTILQGIPLDVKAIHVEVNKPEFMFNPTNCEEQHVSGTIGSAEGASAPVSSRFEAANCASLPFKPTLKTETHAYHTRKEGAYLKVTIGAKAGEANLAKVRVTLPKKLPVDLDTLKLSCTEAQFAANPSGCPKGSFVGTAVVHTPVLSQPLRGPAIFVSHAGLKLPDLALVLQGEGVTIIQEGTTKISKGLTTSSFEAVPDVPVSSIEVTLPEGENPALGGNGGNFCAKTVSKRVKTKVHGKVTTRKRRVRKKVTLEMPTTITGQNGAVLKQTTKVAVTGCSASAKGSKKGKKASGKGKRGGAAKKGKHKH